MTANLQNLPGDVVLNILRLCRIYDVLCVSQTCKRLYSLAFTKYAWLALLQDARLFLDRSFETPLYQLSTEELIGLAKRIVQGPQTWSRSHSSAPLIARQEVVSPQTYPVPGVFELEKEPKLLLGGQYVLFNNRRTLECWSVTRNMLIWTHKSQWEFATVLQFAADVVDNGQAAVILIGQRTTHHTASQNVVEVLRLNFLSKIAQLLYSLRVPDTDHDDPFVHLGICNDIAVLGVNTTTMIILMNWRTQSCIMLLASTVKYDIALCSRHIIIIEPGDLPDTCSMDVWAIQSLAKFWSPGDFTDGHEVTQTADVPRLVQATIKLPASHSPRFFRLSAHDSPLREDFSVFWVYISSAHKGHSDPRSTIRKLSLSLAPSTSPQLQLLSSTCLEGQHPVYSDISYSGHTVIFDSIGRVHRLLALPELNGIATGNGHIICDPDEENPVHISAYGGALTYTTQHSVVVNYYK